MNLMKELSPISSLSLIGILIEVPFSDSPATLIFKASTLPVILALPFIKAVPK